jgi:hypothetical protein
LNFISVDHDLGGDVIPSDQKQLTYKYPVIGARFLLGSSVLAKASHVTDLSECHRKRYRSITKTKLLYKTVVSVDSVKLTSNKRAVIVITADDRLGGGIIKRQQWSSRVVKLAQED